MILDQFNLNHLRIFASVYRAQSMTKAATELQMTQSGVSQQIKILEDLLEVPLFERVKKRLVPTLKAHQLFQKCSGPLGHLDLALKEMKDFPLQLSGTLKVGLSWELEKVYILSSLANFSKRHEGVLVSLESGPQNHLRDRLIKEELDLLFLIEEPDPKVSFLRNISLYQETYYLCASPQYFQSYQAGSTQEKGKERESGSKEFFESLIYIDDFENQSLLPYWFQYYFSWTQLKLKRKFISSSIDDRLFFLKKGLGVCLLTQRQIQSLKYEGVSLSFLPPPASPLAAPFTRTIELSYRKKELLSPLISECLHFFEEEYRSPAKKEEGPS